MPQPHSASPAQLLPATALLQAVALQLAATGAQLAAVWSLLRAVAALLRKCTRQQRAPGRQLQVLGPSSYAVQVAWQQAVWLAAE